MKTIQSISQLKNELGILRENKKSIGFVPTMGYLHNGHLDLVRHSKKENDVTVVSIFVNPTQFAPHEDFDAYPRDLERDSKMLENLDVDFVFYPTPKEMYPEGYLTYVDVEKLGKVLCGRSRDSHFRGVTTVVLKLFNIVGADRAYFGRKDAQQAIILKKMVTDLNANVTIRTVPIVRDSDGLALSSRNVYLSPEERKEALSLPRALTMAQTQINEGLRDANQIKNMIRSEIEKSPLIKIDYVEVVSLNLLENVTEVDVNNTLVAAAVWVGKTRLIDNFILGDI